jgi:hypothetical protein
MGAPDGTGWVRCNPGGVTSSDLCREANYSPDNEQRPTATAFADKTDVVKFRGKITFPGTFQMLGDFHVSLHPTTTPPRPSY